MILDGTRGKAFAMPALVAVPMVLTYLGAYQLSYETTEITVEDKNTVFDQNTAPDEGYKPHNWMVYTPDEVFTVTNDWTRGELAASERYHALKVGETYRVRVAGWRVPAVNWYRNILRIEHPTRGQGG